MKTLELNKNDLNRVKYQLHSNTHICYETWENHPARVKRLYDELDKRISNNSRRIITNQVREPVSVMIWSFLVNPMLIHILTKQRENR